MKTFLIIATLFIIICGCEDVKDSDVFDDFLLTSKEVPADGQSTIQVSVNIKEVASSDRRNFIFSTTSGSFTGSGTSKFTAKAEYEAGILKAKAILKAPIAPGLFTVTVQPEFDSPIREFVLSQTVTATPSVPASIDLETSGFGIISNFASEILLTGLLKNASGKNVSKGTEVLFEDKLLDGSPAGGRFRNQQRITLDSSKVSTKYSAAAYPVGTTIVIHCTMLDANRQKTAIKDEKLITINQ
ncbi:MAG: hypothetical protein KKG00_00520 [Bacteroidetes bacterium]|nr:hypothetical protein [Bacteroidota bacterium]